MGRSCRCVRPLVKGRKIVRMTQIMPAGCALHELRVRGDDRGSLIALQQGGEIPFAIERVYYIFATQQGTSRGFHAHRDLRQLAVCVTGACLMVLDDGEERVEVRLDRPTLGLSIGSLIWREMHDFTPDCVLMVLADHRYDETDYIRDYAEFQRVRSGVEGA